MTLTARLLIGAVSFAGAYGQTVFEVASVKPSGTGRFGGTTTSEDGSYRTLGATLNMLVASAYGVPEFNVEGGPNWADSARWDIEAKSNASERLTGAKLETPLRTLLEQRFQLRATKEAKDGNVFFLDVGKSGVKMKAGAAGGRPMIGAGNGMISSNSLTTALLVGFLTRYLGRPVIDRTGLTATYEVYISWTPDAGEGDPLLAGARPPAEARIEARSVFAALEEDLGLRLSSGKQQVPAVTILSAERPGVN
jgi:uncharacterized protein (TIGR03435 family)